MNNPLTPKQLNAINALLISPSIVEAAKISGVKERTLRNWLTLDHFKWSLQEAQLEIRKANSRSIQNLEEKAIQTLNNILDDPSSSMSLKHRTAVDILNLSAKSYERDIYEERIQRLERMLASYEQKTISND